MERLGRFLYENRENKIHTRLRYGRRAGGNDLRCAHRQRPAHGHYRQEMENFDRFLDSHPQIRAELTQNPQLVNDPRYLQSHEELREFLASHNGVREELREYPGAFMRKENREEAREAGYNGGYNGGYQGNEFQPNMEAALQHLRQAEEALARATSDKGGHRARALNLIRQAEGEVNSGIHYDDTHGGDRR